MVPSGLRTRGTVIAAEVGADSDPVEVRSATPLPSRWDVWVFGALCALCVLTTGHFFINNYLPFTPWNSDWKKGCRQCRHEWWDDFWKWRLKGLHSLREGDSAQIQTPPPGMQWEWGSSRNDTDWFGVSAELVTSVVVPNVEKHVGPVLQIGCGDSPLPRFLHDAGFTVSEHIDIVPQVIETMRLQYPSAQWPGLRFEVRDFLEHRGGGVPPPLHRFSAVVDKAGIWDWLQDEKVEALPMLLHAVREALVRPPKRGVYIIVTKQTPRELMLCLNRASEGFLVDATYPLSNRIAWAYVLLPGNDR